MFGPAACQTSGWHSPQNQLLSENLQQHWSLRSEKQNTCEQQAPCSAVPAYRSSTESVTTNCEPGIADILDALPACDFVSHKHQELQHALALSQVPDTLVDCLSGGLGIRGQGSLCAEGEVVGHDSATSFATCAGRNTQTPQTADIQHGPTPGARAGLQEGGPAGWPVWAEGEGCERHEHVHSRQRRLRSARRSGHCSRQQSSLCPPVSTPTDERRSLLLWAATHQTTHLCPQGCSCSDGGSGQAG